MNTEPDEQLTVIEPPRGWQLIDFQELRRYRDLFRFLVWRDIKVLYAQTVLGFSWAILNPFVQVVVFNIVFAKIAGVHTEGVPSFLFMTAAVIPWTYMQEAMIASSQSLVLGQNMLGKIYFPRLIFPLTPVLAKLVDFSISLLFLGAVMVYYLFVPYEDEFIKNYELHLTPQLLLLPFFCVLMIGVPAGIGMWLSSLAIRYRDVKFALNFVTRMLVYSAPIMYSATKITPGPLEVFGHTWIESLDWRLVYSLNPIVAVIEGFRACLLGLDIPWMYIIPGIITNVVLLVTGALYFKRMERVFVDVI